MEYPEQRDFLKDGRAVIIRSPRPDEAAALLALKLEYLQDSETVPIQKEEYKYDVAGEAELIGQFAKSANSLLLVAYHDGKMIGNVDLAGNPYFLMRHTGVIGMGVRALYRGCGLGTLLMNAILDWANNQSDLELIWLEVYANNTAGRQLYGNLGFVESGRINGFFKHGTDYFDKVLMVKRF